jgi:YidC/Oxa1 family membrane protein insertase
VIRHFLFQRAQAKAYMALPPGQRRITFYSEGAGYWPHLRPLLLELLGNGAEVAYLCAGRDDPVFGMEDPGIRRFVIGETSVRTTLFRMMEPTVMIMTMPDLHTLYPKRSVHPVHYVFVHHSMVSTHMIYRQGAFDHFDTMFCVGPHHVAEVRRREAQLGLPAKRLVEYGYPKLDEIRAAPPSPALPGHVLVAPSWGPHGIIERGARPLLDSLLQAGLHVTLRPHPQTLRLAREKWDDLVQSYASNASFVLDTDMDSRQALAEAEVMVSDWSGAALEFAFGLERPVLFVDGPRKVNNPDYAALEIEPLEVAIRPRIGLLLPQDHATAVGAAVRSMAVDAGRWAAAIRAERERWIFHPGRSVQVGTEAVLALCAQLPGRP